MYPVGSRRRKRPTSDIKRLLKHSALAQIYLLLGANDPVLSAVAAARVMLPDDVRSPAYRLPSRGFWLLFTSLVEGLASCSSPDRPSHRCKATCCSKVSNAAGERVCASFVVLSR